MHDVKDCAEATVEPRDAEKPIARPQYNLSGSDLCNKHGGGSRCEVPFCSTNTYQTRRCTKHKDTPLANPEPDTEPDVDYVEGFLIVSSVHEDPEPQEPPILTLHEIIQSMNAFNPVMEELRRLQTKAVDQLQEITVITKLMRSPTGKGFVQCWAELKASNL